MNEMVWNLQFAWTDEYVSELRQLWETGLSAAKIAVRLHPGLSRNAVIGKARRLKLPARAPEAAPQPGPHACSLLDLTNTSCRFPYSDPDKPDFLFCGTPEADILNGRPYCPGHQAMTHEPPKPRIRRVD